MGKFSALDWTTIRRAARLGMAPLTALLVLGAFSDKTLVITRASKYAVCNHGGLTRGRAAQAIDTLLREGLISERPKRSAQSKPSYDIWKPESPAWVYFPTRTIVRPKEAERTRTPLDRARETGDVLCVLLWLDLFRMQNLPEEGGVPPRAVRRAYTAERVLVGSGYAVTRFAAGEVLFDPEAWPEHCGADTGGVEAFRRRLKLLVDIGLVEIVPQVYLSAEPDAEWRFTLPGKAANSHERGVERTIGLALYKLGHNPLVIAPEGQCMLLHWAHLQPQVVGIVRTRNRPQTKRTAAWWATLMRNGDQYIGTVEDIVNAALGSRQFIVPRSHHPADSDAPDDGDRIQGQQDQQDQGQQDQDQGQQDQGTFNESFNESDKEKSTNEGWRGQAYPRPEGGRCEGRQAESAEGGTAFLGGGRGAAPASPAVRLSCFLPADFEPDTDGLSLAREFRVPVADAMGALASRGGESSDWQAQFRNIVVSIATNRDGTRVPGASTPAEVNCDGDRVEGGAP